MVVPTLTSTSVAVPSAFVVIVTSARTAARPGADIHDAAMHCGGGGGDPDTRVSAFSPYG